jgi:hypothetical protein
LGDPDHRLCLAHVLRDLTGAAELHPDNTWPVRLADELWELIHRADQARTRGESSMPERIKSLGVRGLRAPCASASPRPPASTMPGPAPARPACCWKPSATARTTSCA